MAFARQDPRRPGNYWVCFKWPVKGGSTRSFKCKNERHAKSMVDRIEKRIELIREGLPIPATVENVPLWIFSEGREGFRQEEAGQRVMTIDELVTKYLEARRLRVESTVNHLSHDSYQSDVYRLEAFKGFCKARGKSKLEDIVTADFLEQYRTSLLQGGEDGAYSVKHKLRTVKALLLWGYNEEILESLPRKINGYASVELPEPNPEPLTVEQFRTLFDNATEPMKCWIAVSLNTGATQKDLSTLEHTMIDWDGGCIRRDRNKTGVGSQYRMWTATRRLLKEQATDPSKSTLVLLTRNGQPLVRQSVKEDGQPSKTDMVTHDFDKLRKKVGVNRSFKYIRKTGAQYLENHYPEYPWLVTLYLAHEEPSMRKHYTKRNFDLLNQALVEMGKHFKLND